MADQGARAVDRVVGGYLILAAVALSFPGRPDAWPLLLALHLVATGALLSGALDPVRRRVGIGAAGPDAAAAPWVAGFLVDWYPLLVLPLLYWEVPHLNTAIRDGYFDPVIMGWEEAIFGMQPSVMLAQRWDSLALSETLHLAYLSYYPIIYVIPFWLYLAGRGEAFHQTVFALMLGFTAHYLIFIGFPVHGPFYLSRTADPPGSGGWFYATTHFILDNGASKGAAFPSSHVAIAAIQTGNAFRFASRAAPYLAIATLGIAVGAVYGGFHYALDVMAGLGAGALLALAAPWAWRRLR